MKQYIDEKGQSHYIKEVFCEDGQGVLYRTKNELILLREMDRFTDNIDALEEIKLLPVSKVDNIILPLCNLKNNLGYVLNIPSGYIPLKTIMSTENDDKKAFYIKTGGIRKRLNILISLCKILLQLHSMPVMYGSMSANRILISEKPTENQIYLLYSDGMSYAMDFRQRNNADPYIAPEVKSGEGADIYSDIYAFAALAYDLLTLSDTYPVLTEELQAVFDKIFKEPTNRIERPKMSEFYNTFVKTSDLIIVCKKCGMDFFYGDAVCKNCNAPIPKLLKSTIYDKISKTIVDKGLKIFEFSTERQYFYNYHIDNILLNEPHKQALEFLLNISPDKKLHLIFKNLSEKKFTINGKEVSAGQINAVPMPCKVIKISTNLYSETLRCIDIVIQ